MRNPRAGVFQHRQLILAQMYSMGHQRLVSEQVVVFIDAGVMLGRRKQLRDPFDLPGIFRKMGLDPVQEIKSSSNLDCNGTIPFVYDNHSRGRRYGIE